MEYSTVKNLGFTTKAQWKEAFSVMNQLRSDSGKDIP
jgi:hypothetical protein